MNRVRVQVVYAYADRQALLNVEAPTDATLERVIRDSGILTQFPEIDLRQLAIGVYGVRASLTDVVRDGDRIEIYRPLRVDPKEARRRRAARKHQRL